MSVKHDGAVRRRDKVADKAAPIVDDKIAQRREIELLVILIHRAGIKKEVLYFYTV